VICQQIFSILALAIFLLKFLLKIASKSFFSLWRRDPVLEMQFPHAVARSSIVFRNSVSADRIVVAASRLRGCMRNTIVFCSCIL